MIAPCSSWMPRFLSDRDGQLPAFGGEIRCAVVDTRFSRVRARSEAASDASEADLSVLEHQISNYKPFSDNEAAFTLGINTESMSGDTWAVEVLKLLAA